MTFLWTALEWNSKCQNCSGYYWNNLQNDSKVFAVANGVLGRSANKTSCKNKDKNSAKKMIPHRKSTYFPTWTIMENISKDAKAGPKYF